GRSCRPRQGRDQVGPSQLEPPERSGALTGGSQSGERDLAQRPGAAPASVAGGAQSASCVTAGALGPALVARGHDLHPAVVARAVVVAHRSHLRSTIPTTRASPSSARNATVSAGVAVVVAARAVMPSPRAGRW